MSAVLPQVNNDAVQHMIRLSLELPKNTPLLPLVAFYRSQQYRVSHLQQWSKLDVNQVRVPTPIRSPFFHPHRC